MAPKRKAAPSTSTADQPAPKKRSSRAAPAPAPAAEVSDSDSSSPAPAPSKKKAAPKKATKATKAKASTSGSSSKAKGKKKVEEIVLVSSDVDDEASEDSDVVIEKPKKKKAAAPSPKKKTPAKKSKAATAAYAPVDEKETSTPTESLASTSSKKKSTVAAVEKKKPAKKIPFEQAFPAWFADFAEEDDPKTMGGEGIEKLFEEMDLSMEGIHPFILAYKVKAPPGSFGSFTKADLEKAFKPDKIDSSDKLKKSLQSLEALLYGPDASAFEFRQFYAFVFPFLKNEGAKTLPPEMAIAVLGVVLAPKFELAEKFVEFAMAQGDKFKAMSLDAWTQLFDFCEQVQPDLTGWSEDDAWPSIIDAFVDWKKGQDAGAAAAST
ncbi:hypothetical protein JCM6882_008814 [Rhodosporidiobolus microsporus]